MRTSKVITNPTRQKILLILKAIERASVSLLANELRLERTVIMQNCSVLRRANLVSIDPNFNVSIKK